MSVSYSTEYRIRRAIRDGNEDSFEEIVRGCNLLDFDDVLEIFEEERKGIIKNFGRQIDFGKIEVHDRFGRPEIRKKW